MKPIKVLQVFTILNRGGAETNLMNYYRLIDKSRFQFDFLVHREEEGAYEEEIKNLGGNIFRLPAVHPLHLKKYKTAVKKFFEDHSDYQIIHGQCSELGIFIYEEAKKRMVPVIIAHAHNSKMDWDQKAAFRILWKKGMRKYINAYFTCGHDSAEWLFGKKLAKKAYQMNNAIKTVDFIYNPVLRKKIISYLNAENSFNLIHVGRFNVQKNHDFLIEIFAEIIKLKPISHLYLVGDGELKNETKLKVNYLNLDRKVTFMGIRKDIAAILQAMDVFVFPSFFEGFGVANLEAQAAGMPCVISNKVARECIIVKDNVNICDLKFTAKHWAKEIIRESSGFIRKDVSQIIKDAGYDINDNVSKLEEKYIELYKKFS